MPWRVKRSLVAAVLCALPLAFTAAGCADIYYDRRDSVSFQAGEAQASNRIAHMVDPWPAAAANRNIKTDGQRMQRAIERYRTNRTTPLTTTSTSSAPYVPVLAPVAGGNGGAGAGQ